MIIVDETSFKNVHNYTSIFMNLIKGM